LGIIYILEICVILIMVLIDSQKEKKSSQTFIYQTYLFCVFLLNILLPLNRMSKNKQPTD